MSDWNLPRDLYLAALAEDPTYAPAWAHLGRCHRLIAKFGAKEIRAYNFAQADAALKKALELNPDLDLAHGYAAQLETDLGRGGDAMVRLLERLVARPGGVDLLASLVHVLRYCGLLEESIAVDAEVRGIDPSARTSVIYTHFVRGDFERVVSMGAGIDFFVGSMAHLALGRNAEALEFVETALGTAGPLLTSFVVPIKLIIEGDMEGAVREGRSLYRDFPDPEGRFLFARELAWSGHGDEALDFLDRIAPEFAALPDPGVDPWLTSIDRTERYAGLLADVHQRRDRFRDQYRALRAQGVSPS
jgi:tetratricopeptide (TPR) repeat protein